MSVDKLNDRTMNIPLVNVAGQVTFPKGYFLPKEDINV